MSKNLNLMNDIWYGDVLDENEIVKAKELLTQVTSEKDCVLLINELLKVGDFSVKKLLIELLNFTDEENVLNLCIRLFCSIATHKDLLEVNNFNFLSDASEDTVWTFASGSLDVMSYNVIPFLLALLEEWEDTNVGEVIRNSLEIYLKYERLLGENASVEEIGEHYIKVNEEINPKDYYYFRKLVFPGDLAKELIEVAIISLNTGKVLGIDMSPTLLSTWSGIKCPVSYKDVVDETKYQKIIAYVKTLSDMEWQAGRKYFYGMLID
ncbi:Imm47 family immunity protein [Bacillus sp. UNC437CL72CviS29]|uniref:Imm47 family immunity protein n=1 Tax=Bacillus sp. UNC437CL72CviS29 TaxID=1340430 RepID=UPI0004794E52|nr:Imm47 family immunity protein [Bacillus sp. UNC437CL72CviS29]